MFDIDWIYTMHQLSYIPHRELYMSVTIYTTDTPHQSIEVGTMLEFIEDDSN
jgi:hypothetical protein